MKSKTRLDAPFSFFRFMVTIVTTLAVFALLVRLIAPEIFFRSIEMPLWKWIIVFLFGHFGCAFAEFFFHRYFLHRPFPLLGRLYRQHTLHHGLTNVHFIRKEDEMGRVFNRYPIIEDKQHEASYFPWHSLASFIGVFLPIIAFAQWLFPSFPILLCAPATIAWSMFLYEIVHMIEHLSFKKFWLPKLLHPKRGKLWESLYCFHLRHHANVELNENISGFFAIPIADFLFKTYAPWPRAFGDGEIVAKEEFHRNEPCPVSIIRILDRFADRYLQTA